MKPEAFKLSKEGEDFVKAELKRYESKRSALIPSLARVQKENGWIPPEAVPYLSQLTKLPESNIQEVLMFYTLFNKKPVGKLHVQVCCNVSCSMQGANKIVKDLCEFFKVQIGERSQDGKITITPVECLGACDKAPVIQINDEDYVGKLSSEEARYFIKDKVSKI